MLFARHTCRRHSDSDGSALYNVNSLSLLQKQKIYKVKTADLSLVCDGHDETTKSTVLSLPGRVDEESQKIVMHLPKWINVGITHCATSQQTLPSRDTNMVCSGEAPMPSSDDADSQPSDFKRISRKKAVPRHRCDRLNRSLTSALRPSNYSFPEVREARRSYSLPPNSINGLLPFTNDELEGAVLDEERTHKSMTGTRSVFTSACELDDAITDPGRLNSMSDLPWLPKGVDFSLTVEAYLYRSH